MNRPTYTAPAINVIENEKEYDVELAAPGLDKEDFKVHVDEDNNLHIEMEKKSENKEGKKHGQYLRREFSYEKFQQTLLLPDDVDAEKIEAKVEKGVLNVHLPKKEVTVKKEAVKQIAIQ
jgi:HSP20 family protein